jgi:hypothetical protein
MMKIHDRLPSAMPWVCLLLAHPGRQSVQTKEVAVLGQDNVLLMSVAIYAAQLTKISGAEDAFSCLFLFGTILGGWGEIFK